MLPDQHNTDKILLEINKIRLAIGLRNMPCIMRGDANGISIYKCPIARTIRYGTRYDVNVQIKRISIFTGPIIKRSHYFTTPYVLRCFINSLDWELQDYANGKPFIQAQSLWVLP